MKRFPIRTIVLLSLFGATATWADDGVCVAVDGRTFAIGAVACFGTADSPALGRCERTGEAAAWTPVAGTCPAARPAPARLRARAALPLPELRVTTSTSTQFKVPVR